MEQENKGKITIQRGEKHSDEMVWSEQLGEKEFLYPNEAKEAMEAITWTAAEEICNCRLDGATAILIKYWLKENDNWTSPEERVLLFFADEQI